VGKCLRDDYLQWKISECKFEQTLQQCDPVEPVEPVDVSNEKRDDVLWIIAVPFFAILIFLVFALAFKILYKNKNNSKVGGDDSSSRTATSSSQKSFNSINQKVPSIKLTTTPARSPSPSIHSSISSTGIVRSNPEMRLVSSGRLTPPNFEDFPPNHDQKRKTMQKEKSKIWIP
jgi:hypothetical protein